MTKVAQIALAGHDASKRGLNQFADGSDVICDAKLHRGRDAQGLMHAAEVVVHDIERDRCAVDRVVLAEGIGEAGKAALLHPKGEVLTLDKRGADFLRRSMHRVARDLGDLAG